MSEEGHYWWMNILELVSSFIWVSSAVEEDKMSESGPISNKSMLYTLLASKDSKECNGEDQTSEEVANNIDKEEVVVNPAEKNVSSLYKIISSQNLAMKTPEEVAEDEVSVEYHEVIENSHFETLSQETIAENALYYVDEDVKKAMDEKIEASAAEKVQKSRSSDDIVADKKISAVEITLSQPQCKNRRSHSVAAAVRPQSTPDVSNIRKTMSTNMSDEMGHLSSITFSFLEIDGNDETYDTVDESKISLDLSEKGYVPMKKESSPEAIYSSPRNSINVSREMSPSYVPPDHQEPSNSPLFYAASEILTHRPATPYGERRSAKDLYEDVDIEDQELPPLPDEKPEEYTDMDADDYIRHRDIHSKKLELCQRGMTVNLVKVRSKLNRAWKSVKSMMNHEKEAAQCPESPVPPKPCPSVEELESPESPYSCLSEHSDYFSERSKPSADDCASDADTYADMSSKSDLLEFGFSTILRRKKEDIGSTNTFRKSRHFPEGQTGFEDLRRYIKQGEDFCKELSVILQERSEAETQYAKSLSKLSGKLLKTSREAVGGVAEAWQLVGAEMEAQSDIHRAFANALTEEVVRPLKTLVETQHRVRKQVEGAVDKTGKNLGEWRQAEGKSKKQSFLYARENEKLQDAMLEVRNSRNNASTLHLHHQQKHLTDKESAKLDGKRKKAEEGVKKADVEYYTLCVRAERSRLEWETAVTRGSHCFQAMEEERLNTLKTLALCYLRHFKDVGPRLTQCCERLTEPIEGCDPSRDIQTVISLKGNGAPSQDQLLPDFYAEHVTLAMNRERRRQALVKLLQLIRQDIERERRGKQGVENLQRAMLETPTFGGEDSQNDVDDKLYHMRSMLLYLEAARYKVQAALCELDGRPRQPHPLASHIQVTRDRQGLQQSLLKVPTWARMDESPMGSPQWNGRESGDGTSALPDSDFDEFSSVGSDKDYQTSVYNDPIITEITTKRIILGECRALYPYTAKLYDELNLEIGDIIKIYEKQPDGWWMGELRGVVGIFPATYVEEFN